MFARFSIALFSLWLCLFCLQCSTGTEPAPTEGESKSVSLMTLDPGHFHAALVQKRMYPQISPAVHVYAPEGPDVQLHLERIKAFNNRADNPTSWEQKVYTGPDYLEKMLQDKPGNLVVLAGNNQKKTEYILKSVEAGLNVLSDKPMCIDTSGFDMLQKAFETARNNNVLLYDIMTERYEITTILQKELVNEASVFGELTPGTPDDPSVTKESVHHLFKYVSGSPLRRPDWYFDVRQQGEGLVDVTTHLVDLTFWECFPDQVIDYRSDVQLLKARRWATPVTREQFARVTGSSDFPEYLSGDIGPDGVLQLYSNGDMIYTLKGIHTKVSVIWDYEAPEGAGDTHFSIMKGTLSHVIIRQGKEQNYRPELYIEPAPGTDPEELDRKLQAALPGLQAKYPGVALSRQGQQWQITIPDDYRVGHEAHFGQVTEKYLGFLEQGSMPSWEVPNMIAKYYITTHARELGAQK